MPGQLDQTHCVWNGSSSRVKLPSLTGRCTVGYGSATLHTVITVPTRRLHGGRLTWSRPADTRRGWLPGDGRRSVA
jgi:predicted 2-oxoglutarate/Fe(II)-dependent dioxygenase YbiX